MKFRIDFIGIGALKSGTTWIFEGLREHPEICVSSRKETKYFDRYYEYLRGLEYYETLFKHCPDEMIKGEFSPTYLQSPHAALLIKNYFPNVKLIACLRNPVDCLYSHYLYDREIKRILTIHKNFEDTIKKRPELIETYFYYKHLKRYFKQFPKENILIVFYKDLEKNPIKFIQKIYTFLGVTNSNFIPSIINRRLNITGSRIVKFKIPLILPILYRIIMQLNKNRTLGYQNILQILLTKLIYNFVNFNIKIISESREKNFLFPVLSKKTREYLNKIYQPDIQKLEKLLNKKIDF